MLTDSLSVWLLPTICGWSFQSRHSTLIPWITPQPDIQQRSSKVFPHHEIIWFFVHMSFLILLRSALIAYSSLVKFSHAQFSAFCSQWQLSPASIRYRYFQINQAWQGSIKVFYLCILCVPDMIKRWIREKAQLSSIGKRTFQRLNAEQKSSITQNPEQV